MDFIVKDNAVGLKLVEELGADKLRFQLGVKLDNKRNWSGPVGEAYHLYLIKIKLQKRHGRTSDKAEGDVKMKIIALSALCLCEFGNTLVLNNWYTICGCIGSDFDSIMEWVFNPLMAKRSGQIELALNPVPLTIAGRGSIWLVEEIWDQKVQQIVNYEVVVEHVVGDNPFGIVVRLVVAKDMMPPSMDGSYIPGLRVAFRGILIDSEDGGEEIRVEVKFWVALDLNVSLGLH
ncbi:hypothetical protein PTTG_26523 [Puccinia triticina 1-1 BBBD Race 1]|uniref:Uncharacterized protein n=1 Tax=Puccinia triticina (isolate 1-1 / race 1 (BBBD)) TaxID=630390 RepID=A0A180GSM7_PUCT1|nr:hypothetical protein PTTG_26523 [Puccinia triticina 1-1 BBBD Race 1]